MPNRGTIPSRKLKLQVEPLLSCHISLHMQCFLCYSHHNLHSSSSKHQLFPLKMVLDCAPCKPEWCSYIGTSLHGVAQITAEVAGLVLGLIAAGELG